MTPLFVISVVGSIAIVWFLMWTMARKQMAEEFHEAFTFSLRYAPGKPVLHYSWELREWLFVARWPVRRMFRMPK